MGARQAHGTASVTDGARGQSPGKAYIMAGYEALLSGAEGIGTRPFLHRQTATVQMAAATAAPMATATTEGRCRLRKAGYRCVGRQGAKGADITPPRSPLASSVARLGRIVSHRTCPTLELR
jgi:hypothetical protein